MRPERVNCSIIYSIFSLLNSYHSLHTSYPLQEITVALAETTDLLEAQREESEAALAREKGAFESKLREISDLFNAQSASKEAK